MKQTEIAKKLDISESYLSMILNGKRKASPEIVSMLQSTPGIHKIVKKKLRNRACTEEARGSNPLSSTLHSKFQKIDAFKKTIWSTHVSR